MDFLNSPAMRGWERWAIVGGIIAAVSWFVYSLPVWIAIGRGIESRMAVRFVSFIGTLMGFSGIMMVAITSDRIRSPDDFLGQICLIAAMLIGLVFWVVGMLIALMGRKRQPKSKARRVQTPTDFDITA